MSESKMATERQILSSVNEKVRATCVIEKAEYAALPVTYRNWGRGVEGYRMNETADPNCKVILIVANK